MRKIEFLNRLENLLNGYRIENVDEILRDYEEYFIECAQMGKTEEEIAESLGSPLQIVLRYKHSNKNRNIKEEKSVIKHNITVVTGRCVMSTMLFVMFTIVTFLIPYLTENYFASLIIAIILDLIILAIVIFDFKKLNKYKKIRDELNNIYKKDI